MEGFGLFVTQHYHSRNLTNTLNLHLTLQWGVRHKDKATRPWLFPRTQNAPDYLLIADYERKIITVNSVPYHLHHEAQDPDMAGDKHGTP